MMWLLSLRVQAGGFNAFQVLPDLPQLFLLWPRHSQLLLHAALATVFPVFSLCSPNTPDMLLPQGFCPGSSLCQEFSSPWCILTPLLCRLCSGVIFSPCSTLTILCKVASAQCLSPPCSAFSLSFTPTAFILLYLFTYCFYLFVYCPSGFTGMSIPQFRDFFSSFFSLMSPKNIEWCLACSRHTINIG